MKTRLLLLISVCLFNLPGSYAQKAARCYKSVWYFNTLKPEKLACKLTKNLSSDSEKICAIHGWITRHIKYDVKKILNYDYAEIPVKRILRKRRAICVGYSQLLESLCGYAGISSVTVPGYTKNITVDICDTFYLDDHAWNVVLLNGEWKHTDVTWDAGYIDYWKRTLVGWAVYIGTLGHQDIQKYKPHFRFYPSEDYYMKSGTYFNYDHLPSDPIWQLTQRIISINEFKSDSSYYYKIPHPDTGRYTANFASERMAYFAKDKNSRRIADGYAALAFNYRNCYGAGVSEYLLAEPFFKSFDLKSKDSLQQLSAADSTARHITRCIAHCDSNSRYLKEQMASLLRNVKTKNDTLTAQNRRLIYTSGKTSAYAKRGILLKTKFNSFARSTKRTNTNSLNVYGRNKAIYRAKPSRKTHDADSLQLELQIQAIDSMIRQETAKHGRLMLKTDSLLPLLQDRIRRAENFQGVKKGAGVAGVCIRMTGFDDFDHEIRPMKDTLMAQDKRHYDDLFFDRVLVFDSLMRAFKTTKYSYRGIFNLYKQKGNIYRKLKTKCTSVTSIKIIGSYKSNLGDIKQYNKYYDAWLSGHYPEIEQIKYNCKNLKKIVKKAVKSLNMERHFKTPSWPVRKKSNALLSLNRKQKQAAKKQEAKALKIKLKFNPHS